MKNLINGDAILQSLLASKYASKIGFTFVYIQSSKDGIASYVQHKGKHFVFSTNESNFGVSLNEYFAYAIVKALAPQKVCYIFVGKKSPSKIIKKIIKKSEIESSVYCVRENQMRNTAKQVLDCLLMNADVECFNCLCELGIPQKASSQEYWSEIYRLLGDKTQIKDIHFGDIYAGASKKERHKYLMNNLPCLEIKEVFPLADHEEIKDNYANIEPVLKKDKSTAFVLGERDVHKIVEGSVDL